MVMKSYFWFKTNEAFLLNQEGFGLKPIKGMFFNPFRKYRFRGC